MRCILIALTTLTTHTPSQLTPTHTLTTTRLTPPHTLTPSPRQHDRPHPPSHPHHDSTAGLTPPHTLTPSPRQHDRPHPPSHPHPLTTTARRASPPPHTLTPSHPHHNGTTGLPAEPVFHAQCVAARGACEGAGRGGRGEGPRRGAKASLWRRQLERKVDRNGVAIGTERVRRGRWISRPLTLCGDPLRSSFSSARAAPSPSSSTHASASCTMMWPPPPLDLLAIAALCTNWNSDLVTMVMFTRS